MYDDFAACGVVNVGDIGGVVVEDGFWFGQANRAGVVAYATCIFGGLIVAYGAVASEHDFACDGTAAAAIDGFVAKHGAVC